ncbi:hypothetical protein ACOL2Y_06255 [Aliarcobacter butzleri]
MENIFKIISKISMFWILLIIIVSFYNFIDIQTFQLKSNPFNSWGDFFAGFFAPLAFLWLGYGIYIQREEFSKMVDSINEQKNEMKKHSDEFEIQTNQMEKQITMMMAQDLANWYSKYSSNMSKLYSLEGKSLIEINDSFMDPTLGLKEALNEIENIENILKYNNQIETYFFSEKSDSKIQEMLRIDYDVIHKKTIDSIKMLYIKISIMIYAKENGIDVKIIDPTIKFSEFVDVSLKNKVKDGIKNKSAKDETELVKTVFNNIIYSDNPLEFIKVK